MKTRESHGHTGRVVLATCAAAACLGVFISPSGVRAADANGCAASLNGKDAYAANSPGKAIEVNKDDKAVAAGAMAGGPIAYTVKMQYSFATWTVAQGNADGTSWTKDVDIDKYSKFGGGLYKVLVTSTGAGGTSCDLVAYVNVTGAGMFGSVASTASVVVALAGLGMLGLATFLFSRVGVVSVAGGLLTGIGLLVQLQQRGTVYPTTTVTIVTGVVGAVGGVVLPLAGKAITAARSVT